MNPAPSSIVREPIFVAFDTETTGLSPVDDRVVELAAVAFRRDGVETALFEQLIDPGIPIPPEMTRIHGITDEMVAGRPLIQEVLPEFLAFVGDAVMVAHNAPYDVSMLLVPLVRMAGEPDARPGGNLVLDTCTLARATFPGAPNYRLSSVAAMLGVGHLQAHRALSDVRACREIFVKVLEAFGPEPTMEDLVKRNGSELRFGTTRAMLELLPTGDERGEPLRDALATGREVRIRYRGGTKGPAPRRITPITLMTQEGALYLVAHCHLDRSVKSFRLDQVVQVYPAAAS